jgi:hypothetical protein
VDARRPFNQAQHFTRQLGDEVSFFHGHDRAADLISVQGLGSTLNTA